MAIPKVSKGDNRQLQEIANMLAGSKKVVVVTGAGISTNCGIPDFRSENGLYSLIQSQYNQATSNSPKTLQTAQLQPRPSPAPSTSTRSTRPSLPGSLPGKDLFDSTLWRDPLRTSVFYTFISTLRKKIRDEIRYTTAAHKFIRTLRDCRKLVRCYTQNIDGLEAREGLCMDLDRGKGNRARFSKKAMQKPRISGPVYPGSDLNGGCEVVPLHGDLDVLRCTLCQKTASWEECRNEALLLSGKAPPCPACASQDQHRRDRGKRGTTIGTLRPNIVLYGEEHPSADLLSAITTHDLALAPDLLLILGTSLHVHGLRVLVKEFAKSVHARRGGKGKVVFVNLGRPAESVWGGVIDWWVGMDCDEWVGDLRDRRPEMWMRQTELKVKVTKRKSEGGAKGDVVGGGVLIAEDEAERERTPSLSPWPLVSTGDDPEAGVEMKIRKPLVERSANDAPEHPPDRLGIFVPETPVKAERFLAQLLTPPPSTGRRRLDGENLRKRWRVFEDCGGERGGGGMLEGGKRRRVGFGLGAVR